MFAFAQQRHMTNQYIFNPMTVNPAYAGTKQWTSVNAMYSSQWMGLEGAPTTQSVSIEGAPLPSMGLGAQFTNDMIGAEMHQSLYGNYSYILKVNEKLKLSMGLGAGVSYFTLDGTQLIPETIDDPSIPVARENSIRFDPRAGLFLYSERFYVGFSVTDMLGGLIESKDQYVAKQTQHYYLTAGYVFDIGKEIKAKPSILIREDASAPTNIDVTAHFLFKNTFWFGATYRFGTSLIASESLDNTLKMADAVVFMTEWNVSPSWVIGYAYTHSLTALNGFSGHEIMIDYTLPRKLDTRMKTPRYF